MKIKNLTPHALNFPEVQDGMTISPETQPARVSVHTEDAGFSVNKIPVTENIYGQVENLPDYEEEPHTIYIVSLLVAQASPGRKDLFIVNETIRDENGRIVGARSIAQNPF